MDFQVVLICPHCDGKGFHYYHINDAAKRIPGNPTSVLIACSACYGQGVVEERHG